MDNTIVWSNMVEKIESVYKERFYGKSMEAMTRSAVRIFLRYGTTPLKLLAVSLV